MNDDQSSKNSPYDVRPEGTGAILNELALLHTQSSSYYRDIGKNMGTQNEAASGFFGELADYHDVMLNKLNGIIADTQSGVHTPSHTSESVLKQQESALNRALQNHNIAELTALAKQNEVAVGDAYQAALNNRNLLDFAEQILHEQHQRILTWINRVDRYHTVPQTRNEHYED
jgi:hypothetical protein